MNYKKEVIQKLKEYKENEIIITTHAQTQAFSRGISLKEIKENIINPKRLFYAIKQEALFEGEEKYNFYFGYSKTQCHRYIIVLNHECLVCTVIKLNRRWQKTAERYAKI